MIFILASQTSTSFSAYELISGKSLGASYWYLNWSIAQVYEGCDTEAGSIGNAVHLALNSHQCSCGTSVLAGHGLAAPTQSAGIERGCWRAPRCGKALGCWQLGELGRVEHHSSVSFPPLAFAPCHRRVLCRAGSFPSSCRTGLGASCGPLGSSSCLGTGRAGAELGGA